MNERTMLQVCCIINHDRALLRCIIFQPIVQNTIQGGRCAPLVIVTVVYWQAMFLASGLAPTVIAHMPGFLTLSDSNTCVGG